LKFTSKQTSQNSQTSVTNLTKKILKKLNPTVLIENNLFKVKSSNKEKNN
jgi:hypothetical protein